MVPNATPDGDGAIGAFAGHLSAGYDQIHQVGSAYGFTYYDDPSLYYAVNKGDLEYVKAQGTKFGANTIDTTNLDSTDGADFVRVPIDKQMNVVGGGTLADSEYDASNIKTIAGKDTDGNGQITVSLAKDLHVRSVNATDNVTVGNSVIEPDKITVGGSLINGDSVNTTTVNATTVNGDTVNAGNVVVRDGGSVSFDNSKVNLSGKGLDNGGNKVINVAPGAVNANSMDAVNGSQLYNTNQEVRRVGAKAAALAGLQPLSYDPLEPTTVMAAMGGYQGKQAVAVGVAHYTQEDTMFHAGVTIGEGDTMYNVGYSHKFGGAPEKKAVPDRYKAGPISSVYVMQDEVTALKQENAKLKASNETLQKDNEDTKAKLAAIMQRLGM